MAFLSVVRPHRGKVSGKALVLKERPCPGRIYCAVPSHRNRAPALRQALAVLIVAGARDIYLLHSKKRLMLL